MLSTPRFNAETKEFSPVEDVMDPGPNDSMGQPDIVKVVTSRPTRVKTNTPSLFRYLSSLTFTSTLIICFIKKLKFQTK
jgi:hypothetical protein